MSDDDSSGGFAPPEDPERQALGMKLAAYTTRQPPSVSVPELAEMLGLGVLVSADKEQDAHDAVDTMLDDCLARLPSVPKEWFFGTGKVTPVHPDDPRRVELRERISQLTKDVSNAVAIPVACDLLLSALVGGAREARHVEEAMVRIRSGLHGWIGQNWGDRHTLMPTLH